MELSNVIEKTNRHNLLAPSSAAVWTKCTAYYHEALKHMNNGSSDKATMEMQVGTEKHAVLAEIANVALNSDIICVLNNAKNIYSTCKYKDDPIFSEDCKAYVDYLYNKILYDYKIFVEQYLPVGDFENYDDICGGTADLIAYNADEICIADYKSGDKVIPAFCNKQLTIYAVGVINKIYNNDWVKAWEENRKVTLSIIQNGNVDNYETDVQSTLTYFREKILFMAERNLYDECDVNLGACAMCRYKNCCESKRIKLLEMAAELANSDLQSIDDKAKFYTAVKTLEKIADGFKLDIINALAKNEMHDYSNLGLSIRKGKLVCTDNAALLKAMDSDGVDIGKYVTISAKIAKNYGDYFVRGDNTYALVLR